jgi:hypothetical protein
VFADDVDASFADDCSPGSSDLADKMEAWLADGAGSVDAESVDDADESGVASATGVVGTSMIHH